MVIQDQDDERHFLIRPIERTRLSQFYADLKTSFDSVQTEVTLWELDLVNQIARKVEADEEK